MTWQARIEQDYRFGWDGIRVLLRDYRGHESIYLGYSEPTRTVVPSGEGALVDDTAHDFLRIPEDAARALLDVLLDHFRQTRADENVRADYLAERVRVDKFIDAAIARGTS